MDKKDWTPEELELKEALKKLYGSDTREPSEPLDLSFMNEPVKAESVKRRRRLAYIAAAVLLVFVSSFATAIFISNDYASAVQDKIQRKVFEMKHGVVVATDEEFAEEGETVWEITDFETAKKAKELVPELLLPGYVPNGYQFDKLILHLSTNNNYIANYNYTNNEMQLYFLCYSQNEEFDSSITNIVKSVSLPNRDIIVWQDSLTSMKGSFVITEHSVITITPYDNNLSIDELFLIATELK